MKGKEEERNMDEKDKTNQPNEVTAQLSKRMTRGKKDTGGFSKKKERRTACALSKE